MWALTLGTLRQEKVAVTSASVTTPFLKSRSSSSSDEHLGLVKEKLHLVGTHLTPRPVLTERCPGLESPVSQIWRCSYSAEGEWDEDSWVPHGSLS